MLYRNRYRFRFRSITIDFRSVPGSLLSADDHRDGPLRSGSGNPSFETEECSGKTLGLPNHPRLAQKSCKV